MSVFKPSFGKDALAGLIVFLIALPLCLGIAQASGAPLFSGIIAGVIGGIVVGSLSKSHVSVSGPAAGLVAIVLAALATLGSFQVFLCAVIIAGLFQLILGFVRAGSLAHYFPTSVIEGMLAGIGLTIIIKELPNAFGLSGGADLFGGQLWTQLNPVALLIAVAGIALLFLWQAPFMKKLSLLPAGLMAVLAGILINELLKAQGSGMALGSSLLVQLPVPESLSAFWGQFLLPDFSGFLRMEVWTTGLIIAAVASVETLLCIEATDKLDPQKRRTSGNAELRAQGVGNVLSGLIGGLPITSVIVRSSANINAGATTRRSAIIHGVLLLVCVGAIPVLLNLIPKASLSAILIFTGLRLCRPAIARHLYQEGGLPQLFTYLATVAGVVFLDLLTGVGIGLAVALFNTLRQNLRISHFYQRSSFANGEIIRLSLAQEVSFLNKASIKYTLDALPRGSAVVLDASRTEYIDFDVLTVIREYAAAAAGKGVHLSLIGFKESYRVPEREPDSTQYAGLLNNGTVLPVRSSGRGQELPQLLFQQADKRAVPQH